MSSRRSDSRIEQAMRRDFSRDQTQRDNQQLRRAHIAVER